MNSKEEKVKLLIDKIEPLIDKLIFFDNKLYKILHYSIIYVYVNEYKKDDELIINDNMMFETEYEFKYYSHFSNNIIKQKKPIKLKVSSLLYGNYFIVEENEINDIYFINNAKFDNYNESVFKNNKPVINLKNTLKKLVYMMFYGPMSDKNNEYYLKFRKEVLKQHFLYLGGVDDIMKKTILDKLTEETPNYKLNFYDAYLIMYDEYKTL